jgi:hypothetical protein
MSQTLTVDDGHVFGRESHVIVVSAIVQAAGPALEVIVARVGEPLTEQSKTESLMQQLDAMARVRHLACRSRVGHHG